MPVLSGPNSVPTVPTNTHSPFQLTPTKEWTTTLPKEPSDHVVLDIAKTIDRTELVSVPPMSTTAEHTPATWA